MIKTESLMKKFLSPRFIGIALLSTVLLAGCNSLSRRNAKSNVMGANNKQTGLTAAAKAWLLVTQFT